MKRKITTVFLLLAVVGTTFTSCKKKGCTDANATNYDAKAKTDDGSCVLPEPEVNTAAAEEPKNPTPTPTDADAVFIALQTVSYTDIPGVGIFETAIGLPIAVFLDGSNFKDVGAVTCESKSLEKQANNSYVYIVDATDATGVAYSGNVDWTVAGGNGFPAYTGSADGTFPSNLESNVTTSQSISTGSGFTLEAKLSITNADSVIFSMYGPSASVTKTVVGTISSYAFTAAEMGTLGAGSGYAQIAAYRTAGMETLGTGEKVYFLNEKVNTTPVTFE